MWQGATVKRNMGNSVIEWLKVLALKASNCPQHVTDYCDIPSFFRNPRLSFLKLFPLLLAKHFSPEIFIYCPPRQLACNSIMERTYLIFIGC